MIIDTNVSLSRWPFRRTPCDETPKLLERLQNNGVAKAWTGSLDGVFHRDVGGVNLRLAAECRRHADVLIPFGAVNPTLPDWEEDLRRCQAEHKMPGIRLHPNFHGYALDDPRLKRLLELARDRRLIVQLAVRMDDTRVQHHLMQVPDVDVTPLPKLLAAVPGVKLMLINALRVVLAPQLATFVEAGDVHVEISMLEGLGGIGKLLESIPLERLHFGSHLPLFVLESALLKLKESPLSERQLTAIRFGNAQRLIG